MTGEMIEAIRDEYVFINVKWGCDSLRKYIYDVVVSVSTVVEIRPKSVLPFLRRDPAMGIRRVQNKTLELQFADTGGFRSPFLKPGIVFDCRWLTESFQLSWQACKATTPSLAF